MEYSQLLYSVNFNPGGYAVRGIILYLQTIFANNEELGYMVYNDNLSKEQAMGSLFIGSKFVWENKFRSKRPAIFVSRGNIVSGVNSTHGQGKVQSVTENGSITNYQDLISFPIVVECLSENDLECEALASIVSAFLTMDLRPLRSMKMQMFPQPTQSPPQIFEKGNISFISNVILQVQMTRQYRARTLNEVQLKQFELAINNSEKLFIS